MPRAGAPGYSAPAATGRSAADWPSAPPPTTMPADAPWLGSLDPYDTFGLVAGTVMLIIAAAQWLASRFADRHALRLFALRYLLSAFGWFGAHPQAHAQGDVLPWLPMLVAVGLQALTIHALDVYLGRHDRRRLFALLGATLAAVALLAAVRAVDPLNPWGIYGLMMAAMVWCALQAAGAARRERNVGHAWVAAAFASYPAFMLAALPFMRGPAERFDLSYLLALPAAVVGVTILVVSLIRAVRRTQDALATREAARAALHELNRTLEARVADRTRELRTMVEGLEAFSRQVSHDLRGPLAGVAGLARVALQAVHEGRLARVPEQLAVLAEQADRLQAMVNDLLALSRAAESEFATRPLPMRPVVDEAIAQLKLASGGEALLAKVTLAIGPLPTLPADEGLVRQVWVNLLGNALRFAASRADGPGEVRIGCDAREGQPAFFVADNGPGFPGAQAGELFRPFGRLHGAELSHNGIGLSIVRRAVERHGGRVWAESTPGCGATFWFTLGAAA